MKTKIKYYPDHKINYISQTLNHVPHGIFKGYWPNGNIQHDYNYFNGSKNGKNDIYFENGLKYIEQFYLKNGLVGLTQVWNEKGERHTLFTMRKGISNGLLIFFRYAN